MGATDPNSDVRCAVVAPLNLPFVRFRQPREYEPDRHALSALNLITAVVAPAISGVGHRLNTTLTMDPERLVK